MERMVHISSLMQDYLFAMINYLACVSFAVYHASGGCAVFVRSNMFELSAEIS